jgi:hypothetical protein
MKRLRFAMLCPFFKKGRGKAATSWWNVTPSGNYAADLETGMAYAKAFLPKLTFNSGALISGPSFPIWRRQSRADGLVSSRQIEKLPFE